MDTQISFRQILPGVLGVLYTVEATAFTVQDMPCGVNVVAHCELPGVPVLRQHAVMLALQNVTPPGGHSILSDFIGTTVRVYGLDR